MLAAACAAALLVVPTATAAESGAAAEPEHPLLAEARRNVEEVTAELADARADRNAASAALDDVDEQLAVVEQSVNDAAAAVERQRLEVEAAAVRLAELREQATTLEDRLARRTAELYMSGGDDALATVLSSGDVRDAADRSSYIGLVVEEDQTSLEATTAARKALEGASARFDAETERLERMLATQEQLLAEVQQLRRVRARAAGAAQDEVEELAAVEDDLNDDYDRIAELIETGVATSAAAAAPSTAGYGWPMCSRINSPYGYRWGRLHKGLDLDGNIGDPIGAAKRGTVVHAGAQGAYGNLVLIDHGDGVVTAYGHQSQVLVTAGQSVERGELIGLVGNTGRSTGPHLHFETRVNGNAVNPVQYLPDGC